MNYPQFEAKKIAMKQTKEGYVMSLAIHPDDIPDEVIKDFVGSRYMVVMVRLADTEEPMNRDEYAGNQTIKQAGMVCRDPKFWEFLHDQGMLFEKTETAAAEALCGWCDIVSRSELKTNQTARAVFNTFMEEFKSWKH